MNLPIYHIGERQQICMDDLDDARPRWMMIRADVAVEFIEKRGADGRLTARK